MCVCVWGGVALVLWAHCPVWEQGRRHGTSVSEPECPPFPLPPPLWQQGMEVSSSEHDASMPRVVALLAAAAIQGNQSCVSPHDTSGRGGTMAVVEPQAQPESEAADPGPDADSDAHRSHCLPQAAPALINATGSPSNSYPAAAAAAAAAEPTGVEHHPVGSLSLSETMYVW